MVVWFTGVWGQWLFFSLAVLGFLASSHVGSLCTAWPCIPIRTSQLRLVQRTVEAEHGTLILCVCQYITKLSQWVLMVS